MDTKILVLSLITGDFSQELMDLSYEDLPVKTFNKVPGNFQNEFGSKIIKEFITLSPQLYHSRQKVSNISMQKRTGRKKSKNAKRDEYCNALLHKK